MTPRIQKIRRTFDVALIALFIGAIGLPVVDMVFKLDKTPNTEGRALAPAPKFELSIAALKQLPADVKAWTADHFGFRNLMIRWHGVMMVEGVGVSSSPQVVLGKHEYDSSGKDLGQWLYYAAYNTMEYHRARVPYTDEELKQWKQTLEERRDWLAARGCRYVFIIAPNSQTVYPEFLPDEYQRVGTKSRADQVVEYLRAHSDIEVIDTREALLKARKERPELRTYHRTDTHWNDAGTFLAYQQIAERLSAWHPKIKPLQWDQFEMVERIGEAGDLAGVLGIKDHFQERRIELEFKPPLVRRVPRERYDDRLMVTTNPGRGLPKLVMFRDSFFSYTMPFLAEHFEEAVFVWSDQFHPEHVEKHNPDIVISQMVERFFWRKPPVNAWLHKK